MGAKQPFKHWHRDSLIGFLLGAIEDGCFTPVDHWQTATIPALIEWCNGALELAAAKVIAGKSTPQ